MRIKSDIKHDITTSDTYSTELEIQWQRLCQLPTSTKILVFDYQGRYAASYGQDRIVRVSDITTIIVPMTLLDVPVAIFDNTDCNCVQLCFSSCSQYLVGSFLQRTKKRKLDSDSTSILLLWHIPSQSLIYTLQ